MTIAEIIARADRFTNLHLALDNADRRKAGTVIQGDDGYYWVMTLAQAVKLEAAGYEIVTRSMLHR